MKKLNHKGFSAPLILVALVILAAIAGVGYYVWNNKKNEINTYEECVAAGGEVAIGTEKTCHTDTKSFVVHNDDYKPEKDTTNETAPESSNSTEAAPPNASCPNAPTSVAGSLVIKEWCVKLTFPNATNVTYSSTKMGNKDKNVIFFTLKNVSGDCATLGIYAVRTTIKLDSTSGTNLGGPFSGSYIGLRGDQAGCMDVPLRDKVAQELQTAKVSAL